jgi:hypothetical protein
MKQRIFHLQNGLIYTDDVLGLLNLEDVDRSFEMISGTKVSYIIEHVQKYGYCIDWGGKYIAWDKTVYSMRAIFNITKSGYESAGFSQDTPLDIIVKEYLIRFQRSCRNSRLKDIGI